MVGGGALEAAGIVLIAAEIRTDRRRARELAFPNIHYTFPGAADDDRPLGFSGPPSTQSDRELFERDEVLAQAIYDMLSGGTRLRVIGVALLLVGLAVATAGNVASL
jgi:hypothetical protein